jgi:hypothetical protein
LFVFGFYVVFNFFLLSFIFFSMVNSLRPFRASQADVTLESARVRKDIAGNCMRSEQANVAAGHSKRTEDVEEQAAWASNMHR